MTPAARLRTIGDEWVPARRAVLGLAEFPADYARHVADDALIEAYVAVAAEVADRVTLAAPTMLKTAEVVFEGAQASPSIRRAALFFK